MFNFCPNCGVRTKVVKHTHFTCDNCLKTFYFSSKIAVGIVPVFKGEILLAVRGIEPDKGDLDTIGGFLKNGEAPDDGALREFEEETGMKINAGDLKFIGHIMSKYADKDEVYEVLNVVYTIDFNEKVELKAQDDVEALLWLPLKSEYEGYEATDFTQDVLKRLQEKL